MFGPDFCGSTDKVHFIFRHKNPKSGEFEEKHLSNPPRVKRDRRSHIYTLSLKPDNSFEIFIDSESVKKGSLLQDMTPAVNPPAQIDDPEDKKPADWVDEEWMDDPEDFKPADWDEDAPQFVPDEEATIPEGWLVDEPSTIPDPTAAKPDDWDDDEDGEWEAPTICNLAFSVLISAANPKCEAVGCGAWKRPQKKNPVYKGKWRPKRVKNPAYKGVWAPRKIDNPNFFVDNEPYKMTPIVRLLERGRH